MATALQHTIPAHHGPSDIMGPVTSGSEKMPMITPENPFSVLRHFANSEIFK